MEVKKDADKPPESPDGETWESDETFVGKDDGEKQPAATVSSLPNRP